MTFIKKKEANLTKQIITVPSLVAIRFVTTQLTLELRQSKNITNRANKYIHLHDTIQYVCMKHAREKGKQVKQKFHTKWSRPETGRFVTL